MNKNSRKNISFYWTAKDFEVQKRCVRPAFADDIDEHWCQPIFIILIEMPSMMQLFFYNPSESVDI